MQSILHVSLPERHDKDVRYVASPSFRGVERRAAIRRTHPALRAAFGRSALNNINQKVGVLRPCQLAA
ncbi:hypothetical protein GCM10010872_33600 [Dyella flava]|nr:hypothetical protein GCM10010872_33600 [Dyella flava]